jgi:hypothetical protein
MSPSSLKITQAQLIQGKTLDLKGCLEMEFRMVSACMKSPDFREGIRALLVDKDNTPKWNPASLEDISVDQIQSYFKHLGEHDLHLNFD